MSEIYENNYRQNDGINWTLLIICSLIVIFVLYVFVKNNIRSWSSGQYTQCLSNLKNMGVALEIYAEDNEGHYPVELSRVTPGYLRIIPTCAAAEKDTYSAGYVSDYDSKEKKGRFSFYCCGDAHQWTHNDFFGLKFKTRGGVGIPANYPQYNLKDGLIWK